MMNTAFTVEELADYIEINPEELLKMLREERDDVNWTVDTVVQGDIADKFVEDYENRRQKRQVKLTTVRSLILEGREELMPDRARKQYDCGSTKTRIRVILGKSYIIISMYYMERREIRLPCHTWK